MRNTGMSKWELLGEKSAELTQHIARLQAELDRINDDLQGGLANTPTFPGMICAGCHTILANERDFAQHFVITDRRYLNLGECYRGDRVGWTREEQDAFWARQFTDADLIEQHRLSARSLAAWSEHEDDSAYHEVAALLAEKIRRGLV